MSIILMARTATTAILATDGAESLYQSDGSFLGTREIQKIVTDDRGIAVSAGGLARAQSKAVLALALDLLPEYKDKLAANDIAGWLGRRLQRTIVSEVARLSASGDPSSAPYGTSLYVASCPRQVPSIAAVKITKLGVDVVVPQSDIYISPPTSLVRYFEKQTLPSADTPNFIEEVVRLLHGAITAERALYGGANRDCGEPVQTVEVSNAACLGRLWPLPGEAGG
jgi:hypothetical protein